MQFDSSSVREAVYQHNRLGGSNVGRLNELG